MRELPGGSIVPVAQGVDTFLRPIARNQRGGLPQLRLSGNVPQIGAQVYDTGGGNVQGFNQWAQLATALQPFNDALSKVALSGVEVYASREYEKGRNDAVRAQVLANQQRLQAGAQYAAQNRAVDAVDPIAGQLMDRVNPFRAAGRENQLARLAAGEAKTVILDAYRSTPEANTWAPNDPRLAQIKVDATRGLLAKYGLSETSAGFQDYVNPEIAQAWDRVSAEQYDAFTAFQKDTVAPMIGVEVLQVYGNARQAGGISWTELDPATEKPVQRYAALGDPNFNYGVRVAMGRVLDRIRDTMGLRGETTETTGKAVRFLLETLYGRMRTIDDPDQAARMQELVNIIGGLEVGPPGSDGRRLTADLMFAPLFLDAKKDHEKDRYERQAQQEASLLRGFENAMATTLAQYPEASPERDAAVQRLYDEWGGKGLGSAQMLEVEDKYGRVVGNIAERNADQTGIEEFMAVLQNMDPAGFSAPEAMQELKARLAGLPNDMQADYLRRFGALAESKGKEAQNSKRGVIDPILNQGIAAALRREYPRTVTEAALRGVRDIQGWMAFGDANVRTAAARLTEGARKHMQARMDEAAAKAGRRLSNTEQTAVATQAFNEYLNTKDQELRKFLFPGGLSGGPGVEGGRVQPPQPAAGAAPPPPPPGRTWSRTPTVTSGNLDNVDPKVLESGAVVLEKPSAQREVLRVLQGQTPSAAVQRAAKAAGMSPGQWLLRQIDAYPGAIDPAARKQLLDRIDKGTAAGQRVSSSATTTGPFARAGGMWLDLLLGVRPAVAAQGGGGSLRPFLQAQPSQGGTGQPLERPESVVFERPGPRNQPGVDFWFASKRFPALLPGVVKDVDREPGYGNYVVVESTDPLTGRKVDVLYAHLADGGVNVRPGQRVGAGTILGRQGGTGNVSSADGTIASVDFLAPAPRGSKSMAPYSGFDRLRRHLAAQLQGGKLRSGGEPAGPASPQIAGRGPKANQDRFLNFLAELESDGRNNVPSYTTAQGGGRAMGRLQFTPITLDDAEQRFGIARGRLLSNNARVQYAAVMEFIQKAHPDAYRAINRGDFATAERLLNRRWVSLRGGSEEARPERRRRAERFLRS